MDLALASVIRRPRPAYAADVDLVTRAAVAGTLIGSAIVHGTVAGEHFGEWVPAGLFFVVLQVVELGLALLAVYAWTRPAALAVVVTGLGTVAIWAVSRTVGMPIGPADFRVPEEVGVPDVACLVLELMSVVAAVVALALMRLPAGRAHRHSTRVGAAVAGVLVVAAVVLTAWGGLPGLSGSEAHHHGSSASASQP
ncbi:hypothetical protein [Nocardioides ultimimeridianus]